MEDKVHYGLAGIYADDTAISQVMPETNALTYAGYAVQDLAQHCRFEETAYAVLCGDLPDAAMLEDFMRKERSYRFISAGLKAQLDSLPRRANPMDFLRTALSLVGLEDAHAEDASPEALMEKSILLLAKTPTIVAYFLRRSRDETPIEPDESLGFSENFLHMCFGALPRAEIVRCFDQSLTLYAEHSFNASTFSARVIASSLSDIYSAITGAVGSLKGPLHGGANEAVMQTLLEIGTPENVEDWLRDALANKKKIMGFGHRVYRTGDSRVPFMRGAYRRLVELLDTEEARQYWKISELLAAGMLREKNIHPNLDFPVGPTYYLMGFPIPVFTPIFAMSRMSGWCAHVAEQRANNKLIRPMSRYTGAQQRPVPTVRGRTG